MKKGIVLNGPISETIANMGHTDTMVIADCGLPIPSTTRKIDLALTKGIPGFIDTVDAVLSELEVEEAFVAREMPDRSPDLFGKLKESLGNIPVRYISHEELKAMAKDSKACVRTGECTPYANVILKSGTTF